MTRRLGSKEPPALRVPLRLVDASLPLPRYESADAAAFDLYSRQHTVIAAHTDGLIPLNIVVAVPSGYALLIAPRSSTLRRKGLICGNSVGIIDPDYRGSEDEVCFLAHNLRSVGAIVERGERIAQGMVVPLPAVEFISFEDILPNRGGFGSTGARAQTP